MNPLTKDLFEFDDAKAFYKDFNVALIMADDQHMADEITRQLGKMGTILKVSGAAMQCGARVCWTIHVYAVRPICNTNLPLCPHSPDAVGEESDGRRGAPPVQQPGPAAAAGLLHAYGAHEEVHCGTE